MNILVLNSGSSSIKCQYFSNGTNVASVLVERIAQEESLCQIHYDTTHLSYTQALGNHHDALQMVLWMLKEVGLLSSTQTLDAIGHRVVHGGTYFKAPTRITQEVIETIRSLIPLAPLHNPANLEGIEVMIALYPNLPQVAVFDTAFHQYMLPYAALYPLPYELSDTLQIRRYGFHGTSHAYVAKEAATLINRELSELNLITLHLGNGASATAIKAGISIDTSMGMTPLEGLMMGTRCGDIDPAIIPYLKEHTDLSLNDIDRLCNFESGLKGICGSNDMRTILERTNQGDERAKLALEMYAYRVKKYIGAYAVALGRVDAVIFTGGIGEHATKVREMICEGLQESIGLNIDKVKNQANDTSIHSEKSKIQLFIIATNEELEIARQTQKILTGML